MKGFNQLIAILMITLVILVSMSIIIPVIKKQADAWMLPPAIGEKIVNYIPNPNIKETVSGTS